MTCNGSGWAFYTKPTQSYYINLNITPQGGNYSQPQTINISAAGTHAPIKIYYTTDGSTPGTSSTQYAQPFTLSSTAILKVIAQDAQGNLSAVEEQEYKIGQNENRLTIRFEKPADWGNKVHAWVWVEGTNIKYNGENWPGNEAVYEGNNIYSFTSPEGAIDFSIIFNNGNPETDKKQTDDLRVTGSLCIEPGASREDDNRIIYTPITKANCSNPTGTNSISENKLMVYPNPTNGILQFDADEVQAIQLTTLTGISIPVNVSGNIIDISSSPAGIYILQLTDRNNKKHQIKVLKSN